MFNIQWRAECRQLPIQRSWHQATPAEDETREKHIEDPPPIPPLGGLLLGSLRSTITGRFE